MKTRFLSWVTFIAVMGGLLFGLNMAGISGAVDGIKGDFSLTDSGLGTVAALLTIGCLIGALFTGNFTENDVKLITAFGNHGELPVVFKVVR